MKPHHTIHLFNRFTITILLAIGAWCVVWAAWSIWTIVSIFN